MLLALARSLLHRRVEVLLDRVIEGRHRELVVVKLMVLYLAPSNIPSTTSSVSLH